MIYCDDCGAKTPDECICGYQMVCRYVCEDGYFTDKDGLYLIGEDVDGYGEVISIDYACEDCYEYDCICDD